MARTKIDPSLVPSIQNLSKYKRPQLVWQSVTNVAPNQNTSTSGERAIIFPDGQYRSTTSGTLYEFVITRNAVLSGSKQSGLRTSLSETTNTWYALYAVKATDNATDWILVGDTTLPLQANVSALDGFYGTNGWIYMGMIRNGDNSGTTGDILNFQMGGNHTVFMNTCTGQSTTSLTGLRLASTASAATLTYSYSAGTGTTQIPNNIQIARMTFAITADTARASIGTTDGVNVIFKHNDAATQDVVNTTYAPVTSGFITGTQTGAKGDINLTGFIDSALGVGSNPLY